MNHEAKAQIKADCERDEAMTQDIADELKAHTNKPISFAYKDVQTLERMYFLHEITGHPLTTIRQFCLDEGVEIWWNRYRKNPKYKKWWAEMDAKRDT